MADIPSDLNPSPTPRKARGLSAIKDTWGVDTSTYRKIHTELERAMREKNILGIRLQGFVAQHRLEEVITNTQRQIQLMGMVKNPNVDQSHMQRSLRRMAQIMNQNRRRQIYRINDKLYPCVGEQRISEQETIVSLDIAQLKDPAATVSGGNTLSEVGSASSAVYRSTLYDFGSATIFVQRQYGNTTVCRPEDLTADTVGKVKQIQIHHLQFKRFLQVLSDELHYDTEEDVLCYKRETGEKICLPTERAWRAALLDMYSDGLRKLDFSIDRKPESGSGDPPLTLDRG